MIEEEALVRHWLYGRAQPTQTAYRRDFRIFRQFCPKPLETLALADLQAFGEHLNKDRHLSPRSQARTLSAIKSFLKFLAVQDMLEKDVGHLLRLPPSKDTLAERILMRREVGELVAAASPGRNQIMLRTCYATGCRVSELVGLTWLDATPREQGGGQLAIYGKGRKTRFVKIKPPLWSMLVDLRGAEPATSPIFRGRHGRLSKTQAWRIVRAAAKKAGISKNVSPHWLRHCHATHALEAGSPLKLVAQTLGHASLATTDKYLHIHPEQSSGDFLEAI